MMQTEVGSKGSLSQQLFEAYNASLTQSEEEKFHATMMPLDAKSDIARAFRKKNDAIASPTLVARSGINNGSAQSENIEVPTPTAIDQLDASTLEAWNQIGDLANDVVHSAIVRQAEILNNVARRDSRIRGESTVILQQEQEEMEANSKKRKLDDAIRIENPSTKKNIKKIVVSDSSEEEGTDGYTCDEETVALSSLSSSSIARYDSGDDILQEHIDRIIRMTTYVSELERIHALIRAEMQSMMVYQDD
jgi:hypothetical protein